MAYNLRTTSYIEYPCIECKRNVRLRQQAVDCDRCGQWQHRICRTGIPQLSNQEGPSNGLSDGRVRFAAEQLDQHDLEIIVKYPNEESIDVHLGFLEINRVYEVKFIIKDNLGEDIEADPLQNLHARLQFSMPTEDGEGHDLLIQLTAHKEKLMKEKLIIKSCSDNSRQLVLILNARVLGKGKGKPALKNGIKCILRNTEDDSEYTDW